MAKATDPEHAMERARRVLGGEHQAFRWRWTRLPRGDEWHRHPETGRSNNSSAPWWSVPLLDPAVGDVKEIWEPARFGWAFDLIRGFTVSREPRFAESFLERLIDWCEANPPYRGVHWACGQETAIRAIAILHAEANLPGARDHPAIRSVLAASGERIRDAIGYARSQRNNHAISEAVGLLAVGARLGGRHPDAGEWVALGRALLDRLVAEQFAPDGWYVQHSFTYLRLAAEQCAVGARVLRALGADLAPLTRSRLAAALELIDAVIDPATGLVPNHGPNDGAFVLPITLADYRDFRPLLTLLAAVLHRPLAADLAPDAETLAWLGAESVQAGPPRADGIRRGESGWVTARRGEVFAFLRAGQYRDRPGHFDPLHLDVRVGSEEVVVDPGTFRYNARAPWRNGLAGPTVHNGPRDASDETVSGPRFLWLRWPSARILSAEDRDDASAIVAEVPGRYRREVRVTVTGVEVVDRATAAEASGFRETWLLHPDAATTWLETTGGTVTDATEADPRGWFSPRYGERIRSRFVTVEPEPGSGTARIAIRRRNG
ncbi:MAG: heparinase II/III family protein [Gemmatimonadales bacterium]